MNTANDPFADRLKGGAAMKERGRAVLRTMMGLGDVEVGTSEKRCVYSEDKICLYRYTALARSANLKPVLICYAMVNRPYLLDLQPDRSFIRELLLSGLDVYLLDWGYPDGADRFSGFDAYVDGYLRRCIEFVLQEHVIESLTLLGVCQGGTMSLCYAALESGQIAQLITMVTPIDFKTPENL